MISAVRDKFHQWARGPASAAAAAAGSLCLPDAPSKGLPSVSSHTGCAERAAITAARVESRLVSYLGDRRLFIMSRVYQRLHSPAECVSHYSLVMTLYLGLPSLPQPPAHSLPQAPVQLVIAEWDDRPWPWHAESWQTHSRWLPSTP